MVLHRVAGQELDKLEQLVLTVNDLMENRIDMNLKIVSNRLLVNLPEARAPGTRPSDDRAQRTAAQRAFSRFRSSPPVGLRALTHNGTAHWDRKDNAQHSILRRIVGSSPFSFFKRRVAWKRASAHDLNMYNGLLNTCEGVLQIALRRTRTRPTEARTRAPGKADAPSRCLVGRP